jgi:hypothetical protein
MAGLSRSPRLPIPKRGLRFGREFLVRFLNLVRVFPTVVADRCLEFDNVLLLVLKIGH